MYKSDTSNEMQKKYDELIFSFSYGERFMRGLSLTSFARKMCMEGLKAHYPDAAAVEMRIKFFDILYGHLYSKEEREKIHTLLNSRGELRGPTVTVARTIHRARRS